MSNPGRGWFRVSITRVSVSGVILLYIPTGSWLDEAGVLWGAIRLVVWH